MEKHLKKSSVLIDKGNYYGDIVSDKRQGKGKQIWLNKNLYIGD